VLKNIIFNNAFDNIELGVVFTSVARSNIDEVMVIYVGFKMYFIQKQSQLFLL